MDRRALLRLLFGIFVGQACKKNTPPKNNLKPPVTNYQRNKRYQLLLLSNEPLPNDHYFLLGKPDTFIDIAFVST